MSVIPLLLRKQGEEIVRECDLESMCSVSHTHFIDLHADACTEYLFFISFCWAPSGPDVRTKNIGILDPNDGSSLDRINKL